MNRMKHDVKGKPVLPFVYVPCKNLPGWLAIPKDELHLVLTCGTARTLERKVQGE